MGKVWNAADVERWIKQHRPHLDDEDEAKSTVATCGMFSPG